MNRLMLIFALGIMFMFSACGSKSTTSDETDVTTVDGGGGGSLEPAEDTVVSDELEEEKVD